RTADNGQWTIAMASTPSDPAPTAGGLLARLRGMIQVRKPVEAASADDVLPTWDETPEATVPSPAEVPPEAVPEAVPVATTPPAPEPPVAESDPAVEPAPSAAPAPELCPFCQSPRRG